MNDQPSAGFLKQATFLIDASSYIFRAYYAIQRPLTAPDGTPTHATFGFLQMIQSLLESFGLDHCVLVWDRPEKGYRHEIFPEYKANRGAPPEDLSVQIQNVREASEYLGIQQLDAPGFEADDLLASLIHRFPKNDFVIVTADKDLLQLVGPHVWCLDTMRDRWSNIEAALEKFGVDPEKIPDVQALSGDSVDNIPGIPGVGAKTATELVQTFGSMQGVLEAAQERWQKDPQAKWPDKLKGKCLENVAQNPEKARVSMQLVRLRSDAPVPDSLEALKPRAPRQEELQEWARKMGFQKTIHRFLSMVRGADSPSAENEEPSSSPSPQTARDFSTHLVKSAKQLRDIFSKHAKASLLALDTETFSLDTLKTHNLVGWSFCFESHEGYYVPLRHQEDSGLSVSESLEVLREYLEMKKGDSSFALVFQNAKFDLHAFANENFLFDAEMVIHDTMVASFVLSPSEAHGLDALAQRYLDYTMLPYTEVTEGLENFSQVSLEKATFYAAEDAVMCRRLWELFHTKLHEEKLWSVYDQMDRPLVPVLFQMERTGIRLNAQHLQELSRSFHRELEETRAQALESLKVSGVFVGEDFNIQSPRQVAHVLYEKLGLPVLKKTKTGPSTDVSVLEELAPQHDFPKILLEYREIAKLLSTYIDTLPRLIQPSTGRIHTDFSQTVAATGRLASSNPNLQNIPIKTDRGMKIREAFEASPGYLLLGVDYSQIELRLLAHVSEDAELLRAFQENVDIHRRTAALILAKEEKAVTEDDRRVAKAINYGIVYGQTAFGLSKMLHIPRSLAQNFIEGYFRTYSGIQTYMKAAVEEARKTGCVRTLTGRRRWLPEIHSKNVPRRQFAERMAINSPLQGLAADLMKVGMLKVSHCLDREFPKARLLLQVHDELVLEVPEEDLARVQKRVVDLLEDSTLLSVLGVPQLRVPLKAHVGSGQRWSQL